MVRLLQVQLPVVVVSRDCEGTKTWAFVVYGGPGSGKYERVMYDNGVGVWRAATWLQAAILIGAPPLPPRLYGTWTRRLPIVSWAEGGGDAWWSYARQGGGELWG